MWETHSGGGGQRRGGEEIKGRVRREYHQSAVRKTLVLLVFEQVGYRVNNNMEGTYKCVLLIYCTTMSSSDSQNMITSAVLLAASTTFSATHV